MPSSRIVVSPAVAPPAAVVARPARPAPIAGTMPMAAFDLPPSPASPAALAPRPRSMEVAPPTVRRARPPGRRWAVIAAVPVLLGLAALGGVAWQLVTGDVASAASAATASAPSIAAPTPPAAPAPRRPAPPATRR